MFHRPYSTQKYSLRVFAFWALLNSATLSFCAITVLYYESRRWDLGGIEEVMLFVGAGGDPVVVGFDEALLGPAPGEESLGAFGEAVAGHVGAGGFGGFGGLLFSGLSFHRKILDRKGRKEERKGRKEILSTTFFVSTHGGESLPGSDSPGNWLR